MRRSSLLLAVPLAGALLAGALVAPADAAPRDRGWGPWPSTGELLVGYAPGAPSVARLRARDTADADLAETVVAGTGSRGAVDLVRVPSGAGRERAIRALEDDPAVEFVEPNYVYRHTATSTDPYFTNGSLWGTYGAGTSPRNPFGSNAAAAWARGLTGSAAVYVGVIDEGIQHSHPDLAGKVGNPGEIAGNGVDDDGNDYVDDVYGWDFAGGNASVYDGGVRGRGDDHGTHVAGTIGAKADGAGMVGVDWNVRLISGKFLGTRGGTAAQAVEAVDYFTDLKVNRRVNVVATNNSWGGGGFSTPLRDAIRRADAAGILFVAAAGNGGFDGVGDDNDRYPTYPASYDVANVVSVASITSNGSRSGFSNYGATDVDLGAPGSGVLSTTAFSTYSTYSGTSMATPHVTGAAALYAAAKPGASATTIKAALLGSAVPTPSLSGRTVTGGRLDANAALAR